jgi:hypothetical protein
VPVGVCAWCGPGRAGRAGSGARPPRRRGRAGARRVRDRGARDARQRDLLCDLRGPAPRAARPAGARGCRGSRRALHARRCGVLGRVRRPGRHGHVAGGVEAPTHFMSPAALHYPTPGIARRLAPASMEPGVHPRGAAPARRRRTRAAAPPARSCGAACASARPAACRTRRHMLCGCGTWCVVGL